MNTTAPEFPAFELLNLTAPRLQVQRLLLTFTGCNPHQQHAPEATATFPQDSPARVNGRDIVGTVHLRYTSVMRRYVEPDYSGDPEARVVRWDSRETYLHAANSYGNTATEAQRRALRDLVERAAAEYGTVAVMRQAEAARLATDASSRRDAAVTLRKEADEADAAAEALERECGRLAAGGELWAVDDGSTRTDHTEATATAARASILKRAKERGRYSAQRYGTDGSPSSHDYGGAVNAFTREWLDVPERQAAQAREESERAASQ